MFARVGDDAALFVVLDVLGHGPNAHRVAQRALALLECLPVETGALAAIDALHEGLHGTRGAVATALSEARRVLRPGGSVLFYEHEKYGGKVWVVPPGSYRWVEDVGIPNDSITSIKVPKGYKCKIFEHADFNGLAREITGSIANLGDDWNDKMSSLKVYKSAS